jgi:hypothetical protein
MIAAPFGLAITDKKTLEEVAAGVESYLKAGMVWACLWECPVNRYKKHCIN